jgi:hypothetical protein
MATLDRLRPPSTEPEVKQLSLLEIATSKELPVANEPSIISLDLEEIRRDGGTQPRAAIDHLTITEYAADMREGASFPPVLLFFDGTDYWLADGFHRLEAAFSIGLKEIAAEVRQGTRRDAVLYSVGANTTHGLRRTNADKRRAVMTLLDDEEWSKWSDSQIAKACAVDHKTVSKYRLSLGNFPSEKTYTTKHGTVTTMKTANIGKSQNDSAQLLSKPSIGTEVTVKPDHPLYPGVEGTITQILSPELAIVALDNGERDLIKLKDLEWETEGSIASHPPKKPLQEGINYQPGTGGCEHYVKVEQKTWERLKQYQEELGTATVDAALNRIFEERTPKPVPSDELCIAITSNVELLNEQQLEAVVKAIASVNPTLIRQVMESLTSSVHS